MTDDSKLGWTTQQWLDYANQLLIEDSVTGRYPAMKDYEEAFVAYEQVLQITPNCEEALHGKGLVFYVRGGEFSRLCRYEDAIAAYGQALQLLPDGDEKEQALSFKWSAMQKSGQYENLIVLCNQTLVGDSDNIVALYYKANALCLLRQCEDAIAVYDQILESLPCCSDTLFNKGTALQQLGRYKEAIASYDRIKSTSCATDALLSKGEALEQLGRYEEAIASYDRLLQFSLGHVHALFNRGRALGQLGRYEEAIVCFDQVLTSTYISGKESIKQRLLAHKEMLLKALEMNSNEAANAEVVSQFLFSDKRSISFVFR